MDDTSADFRPMPDGIGWIGAVPTIAGSPLCPAAPCAVVAAPWQKKTATPLLYIPILYNFAFGWQEAHACASSPF